MEYLVEPRPLGQVNREYHEGAVKLGREAASRPWALPLLVRLMRSMPAVTSHAVGCAAACGGCWPGLRL